LLTLGTALTGPYARFGAVALVNLATDLGLRRS